MGVLDTERSNALAAVNALADDAEQEIAAADETIAGLQRQVASDTDTINTQASQISSLHSANSALGETNATLSAEIAKLQNVKVFERLESNVWGQNSKAQVGGDGQGAVAQKQPGIECAEFSIAPTILPPPATDYFDDYNYQTFAADDTKNKFRLETSWLFPSSADAAASQCLEMEVRQVLTGGAMFVLACQLDFADNALRYFDTVKKWQPTGVGQPRLTPGKWYRVVLEGHRDAATLYYEAITINGVRTALSVSSPSENLGWTPMIRAALQLDGGKAGAPYRVKIDDVRLTVSEQ